jgi:putative aldouronate transport system substrate-binding protein
MLKRKSKTALLLTLALLLAFAWSGCNIATPSPAPAQTTAQIATPTTAETIASPSTAPTAVPDTVLPIVEKPTTITYWVANQFAGVVTSYGEVKAVQYMEQQTGIHVEYTHPTAGQEAQAYSLMLSSGNLPDVIQEREEYPLGTYYPGGGDKAITDGVYLDLTDLIKQYAPHYQAWLVKPETSELLITDTGKHWAMYHVTESAEPPWTGYVVRKDWLDELNLPIPVTLDDWHTVLKAFKEKKNCEFPLLVQNTGVPLYNHIISAFDVGGGFYQVNGKVFYGPAQPGYKDYLTLMNQWYSEGIMDKDFMGRTDPSYATMAPANLATTGKAGMFPTVWGLSSTGYINQGMVTDNPNFYLQAVSSPKKTPDQQIHFNYPAYAVREGTAITKSCKDPETVVKWMDFMYTEKGMLINNYGIEGDTYVMKDGKPTFTDVILKASTPGGASYAWIKNTRGDGPGIVDFTRVWQFNQKNTLDALKVWVKDDISYIMPPITFTQEEASDNSNIMPDVTTYVNEKTVKFITGEEPLTNFDSFVQNFASMNLARAIAIQQAALERFNGRK